MPTLLVATDLSPAAEPALALARTWARALGAKVVLLHVVADPELAPALTADAPGDAKRAQLSLDQLAGTFGGIPTSCEVRCAEDVAAEITASAAANGADWLLIGTQGRGALHRLRFGSVAAKVARSSTVPVVCVPSTRPV
jgi:nucleotide-binding universal stress UspA family protein